jgi:hypothetical protein
MSGWATGNSFRNGKGRPFRSGHCAGERCRTVVQGGQARVAGSVIAVLWSEMRRHVAASVEHVYDLDGVVRITKIDDVPLIRGAA